MHFLGTSLSMLGSPAWVKIWLGNGHSVADQTRLASKLHPLPAATPTGVYIYKMTNCTENTNRHHKKKQKKQKSKKAKKQKNQRNKETKKRRNKKKKKKTAGQFLSSTDTTTKIRAHLFSLCKSDRSGAFAVGAGLHETCGAHLSYTQQVDSLDTDRII